MRHLVTTILFLLAAAAATASSYIRPYALHLLENGTTYSICQDRVGAIWLNTNYGLLRYNGHMLENIHSPMPMHNLEYDGGDFIYCTTNSSVARFNIRDNSCRSFHSDDVSFPNCPLFAEPDTLWIGSGDRVFALVNGAIQPRYILPQGSDISWIRRGVSGNLLVSSRTDGLYEIRNNGEAVRVYDTGRNISMFYIAGDRSIWAGLWKGGFLHISEQYALLGEYLSDGNPEDIPFREVRTFCEPGDGCLYVGSVDGLFSVSHDGRCRKELYADKAAQSVCSLLSDSRGDMWVGSFYTGVYFKNMTSFPFASICTGLHMVNDMDKDSNGDVWIVTDNYGMYRLSHGTLTDIDGNNRLKFKAIFHDSRRSCFWTGDYMSGVVRRYSPSSRKWASFPILHSDGTASQTSINTISEKDGELYLGTSSGVYIFNPDREKAVTRKIPGYDNIVFDMDFAPSGELWVVGYGLLCTTENGLERKYPDEIGTNTCADLDIDGDGGIWVALVGQGVAHIGREGIRHYNSSNSGLADNYTTLIHRISPTHILVGTRSDISVLDLNTCRCNNYSPSSGLELSSTRDGCILDMDDGTFWIGGMEGIESIDPTMVDFSGIPHTLVFDHITSGGNPVKPDGLCLPFTDHVTIPAKDNFFSVDVSDFNYAGVNSVVYEYRLSGFSDKWAEFTPDRTLDFMNLNPGRYRLEVRSSLTKDGNTESEASIEVRIRPRRATVAAIAGTLSILLLLAFAIVIQRRRRGRADGTVPGPELPVPDASKRYPEFIGGRKLSDDDMDFFSRAAGIVEENISSDKMNVPFLASSLYMSKSTLTLKLRDILDMSPRDFIENIRLHRAVDMLKTGRYRISEISDELGFSSPKYFSIRFKRRYGVIPSKF